MDWNRWYDFFKERLQSSPSLRGRGLKSSVKQPICAINDVALFTRAWIEIWRIWQCHPSHHVALFTRAWIEIYSVLYCHVLAERRPLYEGVDWNIGEYDEVSSMLVALFTRAWIEIFQILAFKSYILVALFTRAWIEIKSVILDRYIKISRPLYEGVDWNNEKNCQDLKNETVALFTRAWIEITFADNCIFPPFGRPLYEGVDWNTCHTQRQTWRVRSPSLRGRGLKYYHHIYVYYAFTSPSLRGRGLKCFYLTGDMCILSVALFTRAWIEIQKRSIIKTMKRSRPLYEGVDWNCIW